MQTISIRTVEAIDAEIDRLTLDVEAQSAACDWQDARIDSDEFDGGIVRKQRHAGALHNGSAIAAARNERKALGAARGGVVLRDHPSAASRSAEEAAERPKREHRQP